MKMFLVGSAAALFGPAAGLNVRLRNLDGVIGIKPSTRPAAVRPGDSKDIGFGKTKLERGVVEIVTLRTAESQWRDPSGFYNLTKGKLHWHVQFTPSAELPATETTPSILIAQNATSARELLETVPELYRDALSQLIDAEIEHERAETEKVEAAQREAQQKQADGEQQAAPAATTKAKRVRKAA